MSCPLSSSARFELPQRPVPQPERDQPLVRGGFCDPDSSRQPDQRRDGRVRDRSDDLRVCIRPGPLAVPDPISCCADLADPLPTQVELLAHGGKRPRDLVGEEDLNVACFHRSISLETARSHAATRAVGS